ncbi:MAG: peptidylprolyl isomerase [Pseudodesulfovibrio sp.]|uniref:Peptidyl-prolyl cis-trans isomerase n=1 Tax=Pseudodesulfovibrio aespoeensis (strain ATCC 700646 / DSM 10631 / Aspo-2) TaxID=643562 RepID=E6VZP4_PSEA9|nr:MULTISPECIES: peptidylprolyl isomerase [Pseudodesulfovibrio]MBU4191616.1 peptidylprolyl isomerase [Pseudomonadota bacterium]ADU62872.1 Peptidylprolyl isomerase [Pseudodesulfovibrio aespoeensis Aspo-2]MBU4244734.1 peptidylprolyl isomerase [Pseudomonadota bacterium]MBU4379514.1 peptidylprolyl isomerase [Pseudomonadota bacterium]MBU4473674.1 peptidylprolyl isomerase [Pseudomonadota bacterium]
MENPMVLLETPEGEILIELFADKAPRTVENFLAYVDDKFYDGTLFHRVIKGFMIQAGGLTFSMAAKPTRDAIANEATNGLKNVAGTVAVARTADPHSGTSQFFINVADNPDLDHAGTEDENYGYCVFGEVVDGMNVATKISKARTKTYQGFDDVPVDPISIITARRFE